MSQKKNVKGKVLPSKVDKPKAYGWTKTQKKLYQEIMAEAQEKAQSAAGIVLGAYNKVLGNAIDIFAEELGIADDGNDYDTDAQKFRFVRRPEEKK